MIGQNLRKSIDRYIRRALEGNTRGGIEWN
jgi:hypothetical protein